MTGTDEPGSGVLLPYGVAELARRLLATDRRDPDRLWPPRHRPGEVGGQRVVGDRMAWVRDQGHGNPQRVLLGDPLHLVRPLGVVAWVAGAALHQEVQDPSATDPVGHRGTPVRVRLLSVGYEPVREVEQPDLVVQLKAVHQVVDSLLDGQGGVLVRESRGHGFVLRGQRCERGRRPQPTPPPRWGYSVSSSPAMRVGPAALAGSACVGMP